MRVLWGALLLWMSATSWAHSYHAVRTTVSFNPHSGAVELVHRTFAADLNLLLSQQLAQPHELTAPADDAWLQGYWQRYFAVLASDGTPLPLHWVGFEVDEHDVWIYQEYRGSLQQLQQARIHNGLLFGQFEHQVNTVDVVLPEQKRALVFTEQAIEQPLN